MKMNNRCTRTFIVPTIIFVMLWCVSIQKRRSNSVLLRNQLNLIDRFCNRLLLAVYSAEGCCANTFLSLTLSDFSFVIGVSSQYRVLCVTATLSAVRVCSEPWCGSFGKSSDFMNQSGSTSLVSWWGIQVWEHNRICLMLHIQNKIPL